LDMGIGNQANNDPNSNLDDQPDWTFSQNAHHYAIRRMQIFVRLSP